MAKANGSDEDQLTAQEIADDEAFIAEISPEIQAEYDQEG